MKYLTSSLVLPWDRCIPVLFRSFTVYMEHADYNGNPQKSSYLMFQLIESITYLSQNRRLISDMIIYLNSQIDELEGLITEKKTQVKESILL